jgi:hypothetical protein
MPGTPLTANGLAKPSDKCCNRRGTVPRHLKRSRSRFFTECSSVAICLASDPKRIHGPRRITEGLSVQGKMQMFYTPVVLVAPTALDYSSSGYPRATSKAWMSPLNGSRDLQPLGPFCFSRRQRLLAQIMPSTGSKESRLPAG